MGFTLVLPAFIREEKKILETVFLQKVAPRTANYLQERKYLT